jgi:integrase
VTAVNTLSDFINETMPGRKSPTIDSITGDDIKAFERWALDKGFKPNYVALHMRSLRALFNHVNGRGKELFKDVRTTNCQTEKRAVGEDTIKKIRELQTTEGTGMALTRDIFLFCFCCMGIPLIDAVMLRKSQLRDGRISYYRQKTNRQVIVPVCKEMEDIIRRLSPDDSSYLLPVLTTENRTEMMRQYRRFYQRYMRELKKIERLINTDCRLTSYTPRHSWASIANKQGVNVNLIAQALGHSNANITYNYIKEISSSQLELANNLVLRAIQ